MKRKVILSYGLGVDSTAILLRWLEDPTSRDFDLEDLTVITAMVGDEFRSTADLARQHILPRLREHGVRFVQVAKAGPKESDGYEVLEDSTRPAGLHLDGVFKLSDELRAAATIPTMKKPRTCTQKFKGGVLDKWARNNLDGAEHDHAIGYSAEETRRTKGDEGYAGKVDGRTIVYPLIDWNWDRNACLDYIRQVTGATWKKSACSFCPFSNGKPEVVARYGEEPDAAAQAVELEDVALRFNPRMKLFKTKSVREVLEKAGVEEGIRLADEQMNSRPWAVYRLRRVMLPKKTDPKKRGRTERSIVRVSGPTTRTEAEAGIEGDSRQVVRDTGEGFPRLEEYLVAAPAYVQEKSGRYGAEKFEKLWEQAEEMMASA